MHNISSHLLLPKSLNGPLPFRDYTKKLLFSFTTTHQGLFPLLKAGKAHAVCLSPTEDCIFYLSPLGFIFTVNSSLKCNQPRNPPYVHSCHSSLLASRVKHRQKKKKKTLNIASQDFKKTQLRASLPPLGNQRGTATFSNRQKTGKK